MDISISQLSSIDKNIQYLVQNKVVLHKKLRYIKRTVSKIKRKTRSKHHFLQALTIGCIRIQEQLDDITRNIQQLQKKKNKLINRSNYLLDMEKFNKYWEKYFGKICIEHILDRYEDCKAAA